MREVEIIALNHQGLGIAKVDGKVVFVENALVGEIVLIKIVKEKKNYSLAKVIKYIKISDKRYNYNCCNYLECGGCNIGHLNYLDQLEFKKNKVIDIFRKYNNLEINPHIYKTDSFNYRNKVVMHIKDGKLGFCKKSSNDIVEVDNCLIASKDINGVLKIIRMFDLSRVSRVMIRSTYKDIMVVINGKIDELTLIEKLDFVSSIYVDDKLIYGKDKIIEKLGDYLFYISKDSFFQVNSKQALNLYNKILDFAALKKTDRILDLYCGTGTIGIFLAKYSYSVLGIEVNKDAVKDANMNKLLNKVNNIDFILEDSSYIAKIDDFFDVILVDPPRSGLDSKTLNNLKLRKTPKIIYVSCDPMTLSRDIKLLEDVYKVDKIALFDMFANDYHVESLVLLSLKDNL